MCIVVHEVASSLFLWYILLTLYFSVRNMDGDVKNLEVFKLTFIRAVNSFSDFYSSPFFCDG